MRALRNAWQSSAGPCPETLTAVLLAPTQAGKSTTIDELYAVQCNERPSEVGSVEIGNGRVSCTRSPKLLPSFNPYLLSYDQRVSQMLRQEPRNPMALTLEEMEKLNEVRLGFKSDLDWNAAVRVDKDQAIKTRNGRHIPVQLLDTPGGDDSSGLDDQHMEEILDMMCSDQVSHISAFLLVSKVGQPFAQGWLKCVKRYWMQFPSFRRNWVFVHTGTDPTKTDYDDSCYERERAMRRTEFLETLKKDLQDDDDGLLDALPHVFIDNLVPAAAKVAKDPLLRYGLELKRAARAEAQNTILKLITQNEPVKVHAMAYRKSENQRVIDNILIARFEACMTGLRRHEEYLHPLVDDRRLALIGADEEVSRAKARLQEAEKDRALYDTGEIINVDEHKYTPPRSLFRKCAEEYQIVCAKKIAKQTVSVEAATFLAKCCTCWRTLNLAKYAEDLGVEELNNGWVGSVKVMARVHPSRYLVRHKIWVPKRLWYGEKVQALKRQVDACQQELEDMEAQKTNVTEELAFHREEVKMTGRQIAFLTTHSGELSLEDIPLPQYRALKSFYFADHGEKELDLIYFESRGVLDERNELFANGFLGPVGS